MTVGKDVSSSSVFEGRWRLCRGDVRRQAIPDSRCSRAEDSIADCFQSGTPDDQFVTWRRLQSPAWVIVDCPLQVCRQVFWYRAILRQRNTRTARRNEIRSGMRSQCRSRSRGVMWSYFRPLHTNLDAALSTDCRRSCKRRDIPMRFSLHCRNRSATAPTRWRESKIGWLTERRMLLSQSCKTAGYSPRHVSLHWQVAVQKYAQIANGLCRIAGLTVSPQTEYGSLGTRCCWRFETHQSTFVLAAFSYKRLDAIHLSTSLMHTVTPFCRAWVRPQSRNHISVCHQRKDVDASRFTQQDQ